MGLNLLRLFQLTPEKPLGGRYKVISKLEAGGFGQTFLAEDMHLPDHPRCVVKQLKPQVSDADSLQTARRLFDTEAKVLYQLGNHDQIPRLMAHFEDNQEFYLVQELIEGEPLSQELVVDQPWPEAKVIALLKDILQALAFVHQQQVIHRDIKPPNLIRRRQDGKIVLIDFGAVKQVSTQTINSKAGQTNLTIAIGTQGYMPNEQLAGNPRFSSDIYAVGMIGIQALTGVDPRHLSQDPLTGEINWRDYATQASQELVEILERMVRYNFYARYPTAVEALEAVQSLPTALTQSLPLPQQLFEATEVLPSRVQPPTTATNPTRPVLGLPPINNLGLTEPPVQFQPAANSTAPTEVLAKAQRSQRSGTSRSMVAIPRLTQRQSKPWLVLPVFVAVGATFLIAKALLSPQPASQTASSGSVSVDRAAPPQTSPSSLDPPIAEILSQADRLRKAKQDQQALNLYDEVIASNPDVATAHWGRCYSLNRLQRYQEAIAACDQAIALNRNFSEALWSKGYALDQLQRYQEAIELYDRAIAVQPDFAEAWNNKGTALRSLKRLRAAVDAFDKAIALKPDFAEAWNSRGAALWDLGRYDEAIASIDKAIQIQPDYKDAINLRQQVLQKPRRYEVF